MKEQIVKMARQMVGSDITIRPNDVDAIIEAGWGGIEIGTVVYKDRIQDATVIYTKTGANEVKINAGQTITVTDQQKTNMVATYATISIIGPRQ